MAKREWMIPIEEGGTEEAQRYGEALGLIGGGELNCLLTELISMMNRQGGQFYFAAVRAKFDQEGNRVPSDAPDDTPGVWETVGYRVVHETRDIRIVQLERPPDEIEAE